MKEPQVFVWEYERCPCGRLVAFLPGQTVNECGKCKQTVTHGVG